MKVSLNWLQEVSNFDLKQLSIDEIIKHIGSQLGAIEDVIDLSTRYKGILIAEVISCEAHPNADKLNICKIDDNGIVKDIERDESGYIQVVCGAPNVRSNMKVVWLPPGTTVPSSIDEEPFILGSRELRGVMSNGMLASAHELAISNDHQGILELDQNAKTGSYFAEEYGLNDIIIDLENKMFTHRPDCFGILGVARELAGITNQKFVSPEWYKNLPTNNQNIENELEFSIKNEIDELVPRFTAVTLSNVNVKSSPLWLQITLSKVGIKPINNIVDITNYIMHLTGQPLHAFDYDKVKSVSDKIEIFPRIANKGEKLRLLGYKEIELNGNEIVISTDKQPIALGGVMGGQETEVDEGTKNIIIECATFDMYSIRRTSMRHGLFTDAVTRYNKGQSPLQNDRIIRYAVSLITELFGAKQSSRTLDSALNDDALIINSSNQPMRGPEVIELDFINERLGSQLNSEQVIDLLSNVEFEVFEKSQNLISYWAPFWRMDIELPEDIVEEVGRLYGYNKLPVKLPTRSIKPTNRNKLFDYRNELRQSLKELGANEVLTYSFIHGDILRKFKINPELNAYHLRNALSPELQYFRPSLLPSLITKVHSNIKSQAGTEDNQFALYELGKIHIKDQLDTENLPIEQNKLSLIIAADDKTAKSHQNGTAYYLVKKYLDELTYGQAKYVSYDGNTNEIITAPFAPGRSAKVFIGTQEIGVIGEFKQSILKDFKLPNFIAGLEIDYVKLKESTTKPAYIPLPEFPEIKQDITLEVPEDTTFESIFDQLLNKLNSVRHETGIESKVLPISLFKSPDINIKKITFRITIWHQLKTLTTEEANKIIESLK